MPELANSSDLSKVPFSLPLSTGPYPFRLSEEEKKLDPDAWAWLFLRLNPLYQHDYALWKARAENWKEVPPHFRPNGPVVFPLPPELLVPKNGQSALGTSFPTAVAHLDSRYFAIDGEPLGNQLNDLAYEAETLGAYIERNGGSDLVKRIRIRDFDAARDYGIGAWIDPQLERLPPLRVPPNVLATGIDSWFYLGTEPIWQVNTPFFMPAELELVTRPDRQRVYIGGRHLTRHRDSVEVVLDPSRPQVKELRQLKKGAPIPPNSASIALTTTQLQFLVCLDGYVRPQLALAFRVADEFLALHKEYYPRSVQRGAPAIPFKIDTLPNSQGHGMGLFSHLSGPAVRARKNWRAVTIDVAAAPGEQRRAVERSLLAQQIDLGNDLSFPVRQRPRGEDNEMENALKRALCVFELHKHGISQQGARRPLSQIRMNHAIYCEGMPQYHEIRGLPIPPSIAKAPDDASGAHYVDRVRQGLELGCNLVVGWYEFVASRQFED